MFDTSMSWNMEELKKKLFELHACSPKKTIILLIVRNKEVTNTQYNELRE